MTTRSDLHDRIRGRLDFLYGPRGDDCFSKLMEIVDRHAEQFCPPQPRLWDQSDIVLITYADQIRQQDGPALPALTRFLTEEGLDRLINTVHLLPFYPYSSDDGFSVIDYRQVAEDVGGWEDVRGLGEHVGVMFDLVLNHVSQHSQWFQHYLAGREPYTNYFIEADTEEDLSGVTRPRSLPLLTPFETSRGTRHVWTTFSDDQIDLNFAEPAVLCEMIDILLFFVRQGARIVRLDAIAYLWKQIGTSCIHLPQTHEVVKLCRDVLEAVAPHVLLISETNVPHEENVSYFGNGDEAHLVYQFSLPPLLLDAFLSQDATPLTNWLSTLETPVDGTTYFNFTASHDGVGVRPLEGLVEPERFDRLVQAVRDRGGKVSTKRNPDGSDSPYELNITYFDALGRPEGISPELHARRFLSTQAVMLALQGVPGIYFHSLVGTPNDYLGVKQSGIPRRINRRKYEFDELQSCLGAGSSTQRLVYQGYQKLLETRIAQPAFHPQASQEVIPTDQPALLAFSRTSLDEKQRILVVANTSAAPRVFELPNGFSNTTHDLLSEDTPISHGTVRLAPYQAVWLENA